MKTEDAELKVKEIQANSHGQDGKMYMPSRRFGAWTKAANGAEFSAGYKTKAEALGAVMGMNPKGSAVVFQRTQGNFKLVYCY